ncbi:hypothetical protein HDV05_001707 [Chytridiales sp. JEL 0842]|nr:hypothetical protein HDV05_001707 [Chytridiales sp. JEL 0842]
MQRVMASTRVQAINSDNEINDGLAEIELQKLQRQYRIMEGDRKAYSEESRIVISKQRATIEKLKRDNQHLQEELRLLDNRHDDRRQSGIQSKKAEAMADQAEFYQKKIKQILVDITSLDGEIAAMDREIDAKRAELGGVNAASANSDAIDKQIRVLENRLDKALVKFNNSLAVNKKLRATIDNLRRERLVFDNIYRKFERELMEQKKQMAEIIEMSNSAYEARDEAQAKIIALREKADKEYQAYIQEIKELDRALEQDRKLKEFMTTKISDRSERLGLVNQDGSMGRGAMDKDSNANKFPSQEALSESLETYEKAFAEIRKVTGTQDIKELVQRFKAVEDQNFSLFNYVNEVNNEIEKMAEEIVDIQTKIDGMKIENVAAEEEMKMKMKKLEESLSESNANCAMYEKQYNELTFDIQDMKGGIDHVVSLFQKVGAAAAAKKSRPATATEEQPSEEKPAAASNSEITGEEPTYEPTEETGEIPAGEELQPTEGDLPAEDKSTTSAPQPEHQQQAPKSEPPKSESPTPAAPSKAKAEFVTAVNTLLGSHGVTDANLLSLMGLIEQKTNDLLTIHYVYNNTKRSGASAAPQPTGGEDKPEGVKEAPIVMPAGGVGGLLGQGPMVPVGSLSIIAPSTGDDHDSDDNLSDEDDRPLTREELKLKTLKGLSRREKQQTLGPKPTIKKKRKAA